MTAGRVTNCHDLMDATYDAKEIHEASKDLGHVPFIDVNPRRDRELDEFGARHVRARGHAKVFSHLMFGLLALTTD